MTTIKASAWRTRIPPAQCRNTDQSNVDRLADGFEGTPLFATEEGGFFIVRDGDWLPANALVMQRAARLPEIVAAESADSRYSTADLMAWAWSSACQHAQQDAFEVLRRLCLVGSLAEVDADA